MSDFRDSRGREIAGPAHFFADLLASSVEMSRQKRAMQEQKRFQKEQRRDRREATRDRRRQLRQQRNTPARKSLRRALLGAGLLTACLWLSPVMFDLFKWSLAHPSHELWGFVWPSLGVWGFFVLMGGFALRVGLKETPGRVPQNLMAAFWAACGMVGIGALFLKIVPADASAAYLVRGLYAPGFAVLAVVFWIVGLASGNAARRMRRLANRRNAALHPSRPRRWFFLWLW
jgi:hypothetical protein